MAIVDGVCDPAFQPVRDTLEALLQSGEDVGASAAVVHGGRLVADLWGGHLDTTGTRPWRQDTILNVWSTTKTMTNLSALILADNGELDVNAPVSRYWPEFRTNGKERVLVRHLLGHTAGLPTWRQPISVADLYDWEKVTSLLAGDEPWWEPGTAGGYHGMTQGYLVGEVVRRVTGQSIGTWFAQQVAQPLGADFHIGTPPEADDRIANVIPPSTSPQFGADDPDSIPAQVRTNPQFDAAVSATEPWRRAEIPAANGHGNARSVAVVQSLVSGLGETHGIRLLSPAGCERIFTEQASGTDLVLEVPTRYGIGYGLPTPEMPFPSPQTCYWGGWGGSLVINDIEHQLTVAYVMNRMGDEPVGDLRAARIIGAAYASLQEAGGVE